MPEGLGPSLKDIIKGFLTRIGATQQGEEAGSGIPVSDDHRKAQEDAYKADPDGFIDGAIRKHWSHPDSPTHGMPPDDE